MTLTKISAKLNLQNQPGQRFNVVPILLALLIILYVGAIMGLHWLRQERFMNGFDLAFYEQAAWNTGHGRFLEVSGTDFSHSLLGTDVILIVALMTPLYMLVQSPLTLLFQETLVVALGAIPVYWLARDRLGNRVAGLLFALTYLLLLGVQNGNLYELRFRPMAMSFLLFAFYYYERGRFWPFLAFATLALTCRPENGLVLIMLALYGFIKGRPKIFGWHFVIGPLILGAVWFTLATLVIIPGLSTGSIALSENFAGGSPQAALIQLFTNPVEFFSDNSLLGKLCYLPLLLLPLLFLPLGSPTVLLMALPLLAINLLSKRPMQWNAYDYHYQGSIIPWLLAATIFTLEKWQTKPLRFLRRIKSNLFLPGAVLAATVAIYLLFNLIFSLSSLKLPDDIARTDNGIAKILTRKEQPRWEAGKELLKLIPPDAPLAITNLWSSQVKPRQGLWLFRNKTLYSVHPTLTAQYIFADLRSADDKPLIDELPPAEWEVLDQKQDYILLKKKKS
ncbi:MAG: DUF2079 domain-containing protein [Chloroflexota bacterium]